MSGTNWTPGPWRVVLDRDDDDPESPVWGVSVVDATGVGVWFCAGFRPDEADEILANAHVTAAALDMYQTLDEILYLMATIDVQTDLGQKEIAALIRGNVTQITAAMRKARGGLDPYGLPYPDGAVRR